VSTGSLVQLIGEISHRNINLKSFIPSKRTQHTALKNHDCSKNFNVHEQQQQHKDKEEECFSKALERNLQSEQSIEPCHIGGTEGAESQSV
jgi:hypothetical protein